MSCWEAISRVASLKRLMLLTDVDASNQDETFDFNALKPKRKS
jgi:hypothetical protein